MYIAGCTYDLLKIQPLNKIFLINCILESQGFKIDAYIMPTFYKDLL